MKYINAKEVLPTQLIDEIRKHVEGIYVYIPKSKGNRNKWGSQSKSRQELNRRNNRIYNHFLGGIDYRTLSKEYYLSEKSIRRIVLEKKRENEPMKDKIIDITKHWGIESDVIQIHQSSWQVGDYVLKVYTKETELKRNIRIFRALNTLNVPVPEVKTLLTGEDYYKKDDVMYLLTSRLLGNRRVDYNAHSDWFYEFGEVLGSLHIAFDSLPNDISYWNNSLLEEMKGWVIENIEKFKPDFLPLEEVTKVIQSLEENYSELQHQMIHRDVHVGNFLFDQGKFSGYIDFDLTQSNIRIFDIGYFLLGLLCDENKDTIKEDQWMLMVKEVVSGYNSKQKLSKSEIEAIPITMMNIEILFVAYFLSNDDIALAEDAARLFNFIKSHEQKLYDVLIYNNI